MKTALKLTIKEFDCLENTITKAEYNLEEQIFIDDDEHTAHYKLQKYLEGKVLRPYLSWSQEIYPKMEIEKIYLR
jgi:hypothetical protein